MNDFKDFDVVTYSLYVYTYILVIICFGLRTVRGAYFAKSHVQNYVGNPTALRSLHRSLIDPISLHAFVSLHLLTALVTSSRMLIGWK